MYVECLRKSLGFNALFVYVLFGLGRWYVVVLSFMVGLQIAGAEEYGWMI